jgi:hypothetical protein
MTRRDGGRALFQVRVSLALGRSPTRPGAAPAPRRRTAPCRHPSTGERADPPPAGRSPRQLAGGACLNSRAHRNGQVKAGRGEPRRAAAFRSRRGLARARGERRRRRRRSTSCVPTPPPGTRVAAAAGAPRREESPARAGDRVDARTPVNIPDSLPVRTRARFGSVRFRPRGRVVGKPAGSAPAPLPRHERLEGWARTRTRRAASFRRAAWLLPLNKLVSERNARVGG